MILILSIIVQYLNTAVVVRGGPGAPVIHTVVTPTGQTPRTLRVLVTVPVGPITGGGGGAAGVLTPRAPTASHAAIRGGIGSWVHQVTVVRATHQVSVTVGVRVAVSAPQTTRRAWSTAGVLSLSSVTVLAQSGYSICNVCI